MLTILTTSSAVFLITAGVVLANKNSNFYNDIFFNLQKRERPHKINGHRLIEVGYYWDSYARQVRIRQIPAKIKTIAAELPPEITSLKGAFQTIRNNINWEVAWNTKNITNMNSMFYNTIWFNSDAILKWDTSNVTDMGKMFGRAIAFNQDLSGWDVSKVKNFEGMFEGATEYNSGGNHLNWKDKLKNANNMKKMFDNTPKFTHKLTDWKFDKEVKNDNFGLAIEYQPQWAKIEAAKPIITPTDISSRSEKMSPTAMPSNVEEQPSNSEIESNSNTLNSEINKPEANNQIISSIESEKNIESKEKGKGEASIKDKSENLKNNNYIIPPYKPNTLVKSNSPNAGVIIGAVLGSFTVLGTTAGLGYYYRKNLKNLYLKSVDKIKPSLLKSKDNIKDFYVKSIDKTKNLYLKSKNKIKDKIAKIKSKK
ncbi:BspA family leucine-rich repeat surface protein [Mycoplasma capricolum subsp. capripneumoniae]|nr:BspA family leucine-rich repeat surface protein [Mycoplasma capricolum subsp. capripneumoniae]QIN44004.1 BspA family leucine-rich repeat surface protein [Mycoplasma capricolum subsp. capripneumoniae]QIN46747.1 BspA family leucine-rich repeat surface protein [Mycoplasma capricolum subsp. capripneumoniae]QIN47438.1 BspA family leucine-rich repeat surface protein [Mycoplasma capricolum subsp. capripneumoniae]QIN48810.1 BspA family leucine-rich repeat surface protein [Mycoplasma capricolum subsp